MPTTPYAKLLISVAGGAAASGGQSANAGDALTFSFESTVGWTSGKVEIYSYPSSFSAPAGWSTDAAGVIYYSGTTPPPGFTLSADAADWGKYLFRLTANGGLLNGVAASQLVDEASGISVASANGLTDIAYLESTQFSSKSWPGALQETLRSVDDLISAGGVASISAAAPITSTGGATPEIGIDPASHTAAGSMSSAHFDLLDLATSAADANSMAKRGASAECSFGSLTCTTLDASSTVTCTGVTSSGPVSCTTLTASGAASCDSLTVGGKAIQGFTNSTKTASFTAAFGGFYEFTPSAASQVVTCPDPTGASGQGFTILALNTTAFSISLSSKTVNGVSSLTVTPAAAYQAITVVALSDGNFAAVGV